MAGQTMFRVVEVERKKYDALDVRDAIAATVDGMCEHFGIAGTEERANLYAAFAREARAMRAEL